MVQRIPSGDALLGVGHEDRLNLRARVQTVEAGEEKSRKQKGSETNTIRVRESGCASELVRPLARVR